MKKIIIAITPVIFILLLIFAFSSQPYENQDITPWFASLNQSTLLNKLFSWISFTYAGKEISVSALGVAHFIEFFIRKASHFTVFFFLAFFTIRALAYFLANKKWMVMISFFIVICYAALDEFHQSFTSGRTPLFEDVVVDSVGGVFGIIWYLKWKNKF
ncbi:VanZ family protein [Niallia nealsonii]|uniref:Phosphate butyryltransferase n=1 Tax=Niallia nealsonii TaxID=115979 RepID=A0A2N0YWX7_9BACI|nr:VanZ family protein [Niallia nealsonii]PKG21767.1 phosphate butyryltransferase [Niallia nealsonii]